MLELLKAGLAYFAFVFLAGFVLGAARTLLLIPLLGETLAVTLEAPVMLAISWVVSAWSVRRFNAPRAVGARMMMGSFAFILLMLVEFILAKFVFGRPLSEFLANYETLAGSIGLAAQLGFAAIPALQVYGKQGFYLPHLPRLDT